MALLQILEKMEVGGVMPDRTIRNLVLDTFGSESHVSLVLCLPVLTCFYRLASV